MQGTLKLEDRKVYMKKVILFALLVACIFLSSCKHEPKSVKKQPDKKQQMKLEDNKDMRKNKSLIAEALGMEDDYRLEPILKALVFVNAGELRKATCSENDLDIYLDVVAEDGRNLRIFLSKYYSLEDIQNRDTGEWLITSQQ